MPPAKERSNFDWLLMVLLAACIVRLWIMPLGSSFWVDEMGTAFVVNHGRLDPSLRAVPQVTASVYYALPALAVRLGGNSEIAFRFFSLLSMGGALFAIGRLWARLIHPNAGWLAVFGCLILRNFDYQAADARPYALGSCVLAVALLLLVRWQDSGRLRDGMVFAAAAALLWWVHLIFWPFYLLFALYAGMRLSEEDRCVPWWQAAVVSALIALGCAPVIVTVLSVLREAQAHVVAPRPTWQSLLLELRVGTLAVSCAAAFLAARLWRWNRPRNGIAAATVALAFGWWLVDPLAIYFYSTLSGNSVFLSRYLSPAIPGLVVTAVLLASLMIPAEQLKQAALLAGMAALITNGHWDRLWPEHTNSNWKAASIGLRAWVAGEDVPVICPSPFIEMHAPLWRPGVPAEGFLYSNLLYYRTAGRLYAFPFASSADATAYAETLAAATLPRSGRFAIYGSAPIVSFWSGWFSQRSEFQTWQQRTLGPFGDVAIATFTAPVDR